MTKRPISASTTPSLPPTAPKQLSFAFDSIQLRALSRCERANVLSRLASLLIESTTPSDSLSLEILVKVKRKNATLKKSMSTVAAMPSP